MCSQSAFNSKENELASTKERIQLTISPAGIVRCLLNDPSCREEVLEAIRLGPERHTQPVGYASLPDDNGLNRFWSLFLSSDVSKQPKDEGFFYRTRPTPDGVATRIQAVLKVQTPQQATVRPTATAGRKLTSDAEETATALLTAALEGDLAAVNAINALRGAPSSAPQVGPPPVDEDGHVTF